MITPAPPTASADNAPFECPLCHYTIIIETHDSWARHVFHDLQPYVCLNMDCMMPQKLYASKREWLHHMHTFHPTNLDQEPETQNTPRQCPLCWSECQNTGSYDSHLARHLQELALFVLPRYEAISEAEPKVNQQDASVSDESDWVLICPLCPTKFHRPDKYVHHLDEVHDGIYTRSELLDCPLCPNQFMDPDGYEDHLEEAHKELHPRFRDYMAVNRPKRDPKILERAMGRQRERERERKEKSILDRRRERSADLSPREEQRLENARLGRERFEREILARFEKDRLKRERLEKARLKREKEEQNNIGPDEKHQEDLSSLEGEGAETLRARIEKSVRNMT